MIYCGTSDLLHFLINESTVSCYENDHNVKMVTTQKHRK